MRALLVRVGADQGVDGGYWNGPANSPTREFVYVPIPESYQMREGLETPYRALNPHLAVFGKTLPPQLAGRNMHLDPDFDHLTYGDGGRRGKQIGNKIGPNDLLVFYAALEDVLPPHGLIYALIGLYVVDEIIPAASVPQGRWHENAHTRRAPNPGNIIVRARKDVSGRLERYIPIGAYYEKAYRVLVEILEHWGGLGIRNGYIQRSVNLPELLNAETFYTWFRKQNVRLIARNN